MNNDIHIGYFLFGSAHGHTHPVSSNIEVFKSLGSPLSEANEVDYKKEYYINVLDVNPNLSIYVLKGKESEYRELVRKLLVQSVEDKLRTDFRKLKEQYVDPFDFGGKFYE